MARTPKSRAGRSARLGTRAAPGVFPLRFAPAEARFSAGDGGPEMQSGSQFLTPQSACALPNFPHQWRPDLLHRNPKKGVMAPTYKINAKGDNTPYTFAAPVGFTPAQIRKAYGIDTITFSSGTVVGDGAGQTIAIIDAYDNPRFVSSSDANYVNSDLHKFNVAFGIADPPSFTKVNQSGGTSYPATDFGWGGETALDVE